MTKNGQSFGDEESFAGFSHDLKAVKTLSPEEEHLLAVKASKGDLAARKRLVEANLRLVLSIAGHYRHINGVSRMDLIQEGSMGLMRAAEKFDPSKNVRFSTYAVFWVKHYLQNLLTKQISGQYPTARINGMSSKVMVVPLERVLDRDGAERDIPALSDWSYNPERVTMRELSRTETGRLLNGLKKRERFILDCRFLDSSTNREETSYKNIARKLGITAEGVRRNEKKSLLKLREKAAAIWELLYA